jgi:hypothetical protein
MEAKPEISNPVLLDAVIPQNKVTLRDLFAAFALNGQLSNPDGGCKPEDEAREAYEYADAMLRERLK